MVVGAKGPGLDQGAPSALRFFNCKFSRKSALVRCPCAFRLRSLAQDEPRGHGLRHFHCKFSREQSCVRSPCPFRLHKLAQNGRRDQGSPSGLWHVC